jgi:hypothetical protein
VQIGFKMVNYAIGAASSGLQFRLSLLGNAMGQLEDLVK